MVRADGRVCIGDGAGVVAEGQPLLDGGLIVGHGGAEACQRHCRAHGHRTRHHRFQMAPGLFRNSRTKFIPNSRQSLIDHMTKTGSLARDKNRQSKKTNMGVDKVNKGLPLIDGLSIGTETANPTFEGNLPNVQTPQTQQKESTFMPSIQSPQTQRKEMTLEGTQQNESTPDPPSHQGNQHSQSQEDIIASNTTTTSKKKRRQTMGKGIMKAFQASGKKMKITVDPSIGRPKTRDESPKFSSQVGVVTRDVLPVPIRWKDVDEEKDLQPAIDHMKIHMDINLDDPGVKRCVIDRVQASSRQKHYRLHQHYKKYSSHEEAKKNESRLFVLVKKTGKKCVSFLHRLNSGTKV